MMNKQRTTKKTNRNQEKTRMRGLRFLAAALCTIIFTEYSGRFTMNLVCAQETERHETIMEETEETAEAMWQAKAGGEWQEGAFLEAVAGVYSGGAVILRSDVSLTGGITVKKQFTIMSEDAQNPCTIKNARQDTDDGKNTGRIFTVTGGALMLQDIILDGGRNDGACAYHPLICVCGQSAVVRLLDGAVLQNAENISPSMGGGAVNIRRG